MGAHFATCMCLIAAACYWLVKRNSSRSAHLFLFPFIVATSITGVLPGAEPVFDFVQLHFMGNEFERMAFELRYLDSEYRWYQIGRVCFPALPIFGLLPKIGGRPLLIVVLALLSQVPLGYHILIYALT